jgi:hypothetical protein
MEDKPETRTRDHIDPMQNCDIIKEAGINIPGMQKQGMFEVNEKDIEEVRSSPCSQSPLALGGQHVYSKSDPRKQCIYCGEKDPDAVPPKVKQSEIDPRVSEPKCPGTPPFSIDAVNALMCTFQMYGHIQAAQARIEGMKAQNTISMSMGDTFPPYGQEAFRQEATNIESYAQQLRVMQKGGF